jgi:hypothetical protein
MSNVVISANSTATLNANGINFVNTATIGVNVNPGSTGNANVTMTLLGGVQGAQGTTGIQGFTGIQGTQGVQGTQGTTGLQGVQGTTGIQGVQGTQGTQGTQGLQGVQGLDGLYAAQGIQGPQGVFGVQGVEGGSGVTTMWSDAFTATANQTVFTLTQSLADPKFTIVSRNGVLMVPTTHYTIAGSTLTMTSNTQLGDIVEARSFETLGIGIQGIQGAQGITGIQGAQGTQGVQGLQGPQGVQGTTGIQGAQGTQGTQGLQGTTGSQGTDGILGTPLELLHVRHEESSGTGGGTSAAGAWQTRKLNTTILNTISGASLSANQISLPAGTYDIWASVPGHQCEGHRAALYNVTDADTTISGTSARSRATSSTDGSSTSTIFGQFTIASTKTFEIRHYTNTSTATTGLGVTVATGANEVHTEVYIKKSGGIQGTTGVQGPQGVQGVQGLDGLYAAQGIQGTTGTQGVQGTTGLQGVQGTTGIQGSTGTQGTQGIQGRQGVQGTTGIQGATGTQGTTGAQGIQGLTGAQGVQGIQGALNAIGGSTTQVQFNNGGSFAGSANLRFTLASNTFSVGGADGVNGPSLDFRHDTDGMIIEEQYINSAGSNLKFYGGGTELLRISQDAINPTLNVSGVAPVGLRVANANVEIFTDTTREPMMKLYRAAQSQGIGVGLLQWEGNRDDGVRVAYARLQTEISANSVGAQTGSFQIETSEGGTMAARLEVNGANVNIINGFGATLRIKNPYARAEVNSTGSGNNAGYKMTATYDGVNLNYAGIYLYPSSTAPFVGIAPDDANYRFRVFTNGTQIENQALSTVGTQHLELYSPDTGASTNSISLRFHEANQWYSAIRCNVAGFTFTSGGDYTPTTIQAGNARLHGGAVWSETVPGLTHGTLHLNPNATTDHYGCAITFGASDSSSGTIAQAGIYTRTDGSYGTKMYFATSGDYGVGSVNRMSIIHNGNVGIGSAATVANPGSKLHVDDGQYTRFHLGYQGSVNYMDADTQNFRTYSGYQQLSLYSNNIVQHVGGIYKNDVIGFNGVVQVVNPKGGTRGSAGNPDTGYIRIRLPKNNTDSMMAFTVNIFEYAGSTESYSRQIRVFGYNYASGWANYGAFEIGANGSLAPVEVRFGSDGTNNIVWLGTSGTNWYYPQISITDVNVGYYGLDTGWASGWDVSISATLSGTVAAGPIYTNRAITTNYENSAFLEPNPTSSYGAWRIAGSKGGYGGIFDDYSDVHWMNDAAGNGGFYLNAGVWSQYWNAGHACLGIGSSTTSSSYKLYVSGGIYATGDIVAYSDARKKENVYTIENPLAKVCALRGVNFNRIDDPDKKLQMGVIAQEVLEVVPEVVTHAETADDKGNKDEEYGVNYGALVGVLIEAVKELNAKVDAQAKLIEELRNG